MATTYWTGNAHSVKQIDTVTVANTWAAADTVTLTINGKDLVITCGSTTTTTATVATAIKEAWMSSTRLDGSSASSNATSNFGGQEFGEFREVTASVSGSVVTLIGNEAGKPFTLTVTESTAGSGTATKATSTAATGKHHWDNGDNWTGGSAPANDDTVVFKDSNVSCLYGLPNGSKEVTIQQWMSYTGEVGLPAINVDDASYPYYEYRQRYVRLDDAGTGSDIAHRFGLGKDGLGCALFNLKHSTVKCSPIVYNTAAPLTGRVGTKAINICCTANTSTLNVLSGSVDASSQDGGTSAFATIIVNGGDSRGVQCLKDSGELNIQGGSFLLGGTSDLLIIVVTGGSLRIEGLTPGTYIDHLSILGGSVDYACSADINLLSAQKGTFDARSDSGSFALGTSSFLRLPCKFLNPYDRITGDLNIKDDPSADWQFGVGLAGKIVTLG